MAVDQRDAAVLTALAKAGSDLSLPHEVRHYFYAPDRPTAKVLAKRLRRNGYSAQEQQAATDKSDNTPGHLVLVTHVSVPTPAEIARLRAEFEKTARALGAEYDGWEAPITKRGH